MKYGRARLIDIKRDYIYNKTVCGDERSQCFAHYFEQKVSVIVESTTRIDAGGFNDKDSDCLSPPLIIIFIVQSILYLSLLYIMNTLCLNF